MQASQTPNSELLAKSPLGGQAWLSSALWDCSWIIAPAVMSASAVLIFRDRLEGYQNVPLWVWVCFILLVDVTHVYATLFRTYLDPVALQKNKTVLLVMPIIAWVGGCLLYSIKEQYFWRGLAYLAVFHFIRQQYGFMVLYSRKEPESMKKFQWLDQAAIYMATIYPLLFWHTHLRNFNWFVATDFVEGVPAVVGDIGLAVYAIVAAAYCIKEIFMAVKGQGLRSINIPKNLLLISTAFSWWACIVAVNSDVAFTITNVVSHGVPYMALVWLYHGAEAQKKKSDKIEAQDNTNDKKRASEASWQSGWRKLVISNVLIFFVFMALLAWLEEGFWDGFIWREHLAVFAPFWGLPRIGDAALLALLVPFLSLPQSTHYLLDGFIWRVKERNNIWSA